MEQQITTELLQTIYERATVAKLMKIRSEYISAENLTEDLDALFSFFGNKNSNELNVMPTIRNRSSLQSFMFKNKFGRNDNLSNFEQ